MEIKEMEDYMDIVSVYDFAQTVPLFEQEDRPRLREKLLERIEAEKVRCAAAAKEERRDAEDRIVDCAEKILAVSSANAEYAAAETAMRQITADRMLPGKAENSEEGEEAESEGIRSDKSGTVGRDLRELQKKLNLLALAANKTSMAIAMAFGALCLFGIVMLLAAPGVIDFFNGAWLEKGVTIICAIVVIIVLFAVGFWGAVVTLLVLAGVLSLLSNWIGLGLLLRLILSLVLGVLLLITASIYSDDRKKVRQAETIDVATERREARNQIERMSAYVSNCLTQCKAVAAAKETVIYYEELREELDICAERLRSKT